MKCIILRKAAPLLWGAALILGSIPALTATAPAAEESGHSGSSHAGGHSGGSAHSGHDSGDEHSHDDGEDGHSSGGHKGGSGHGKNGGGPTLGKHGRGGIESHVFEEDEGPSDEAKGPHYGGGRATTGKPGTAGVKKGGLYGDLWVILRDDNGVPILNGDGFVQPIDEDGNLIALNDEGEPIDESLVQEVELGRTNVARSPSKVLEQRLAEAVTNINAADSVSLDDSGRLVLTTDGVAKTIDSPLENLAIYKALMTAGTIPGIADPAKLGSLSYMADGTKTAEDMHGAVGFLAGATDKEAPLSVDEIVYLDRILAIPGTITGPDGNTYVDYSSFSYDRQATYGSMTTEALVEVAPGKFETQTVNVYDTVFSGTEATGTGADGFAVAADDARAVLLYVHDNAPRD
jgi:hypothetical protein